MSMFQNCPRCGSPVQTVAKTQFCGCGWSTSEPENSGEKNIVMHLFLIAGIMAGVGFHLFQWGQYSLSVFFAKPEKMLSICMNLKKYDCVEGAYEDMYFASKDVDILEKIAEFQFRREHYEDAQNTYRHYFSSGGDSEKATYYYAHALAKTGQIDEAIQRFEALAKGRKGVLMVTVVESYLQVLVSSNRLNKAKEVLDWAEDISKNSSSQRHIERWKKQFKI